MPDRQDLVQVRVRMPRRLRDDIAAIAAQEHRSISAQCLAMLEAAVAARRRDATPAQREEGGTAVPPDR